MSSLAVTLNSIPTAIVQLDNDGQLLLMNKRASKLLGLEHSATNCYINDIIQTEEASARYQSTGLNHN
jgi:PAS domain-containing protein